MKKPIQPIDKPTRRTIESFLHHDIGRVWCFDNPEYKALVKQIDDLHDQFLLTSKVRKLTKKKDDLYEKLLRDNKRREERITKLRRLYNTYGLTPRVVKEFQKLAEELNCE